MLLALANRHGAYARVAQIIDILHRDYTTPTAFSHGRHERIDIPPYI